VKKFFLVTAVILIAVTLTGCQSGKNTATTDDAQSALIDSQSSEAVNAPPVPPIPSKPAQ